MLFPVPHTRGPAGGTVCGTSSGPHEDEGSDRSEELTTYQRMTLVSSGRHNFRNRTEDGRCRRHPFSERYSAGPRVGVPGRDGNRRPVVETSLDTRD